LWNIAAKYITSSPVDQHGIPDACVRIVERQEILVGFVAFLQHWLHHHQPPEL
jgi:hypothetical protein